MANYILRQVDDELWKQFRERATTEGYTLKWLLMELVKSYVKYGLPKKR